MSTQEGPVKVLLAEESFQHPKSMYAAAIAAAVVATAIAVFVEVLILDNERVALVAAELAAFDFDAD